MNKTQKLILAIFVPIIFFFIALVIADNLGVTRVADYKKLPSYTNNPFDWGKIWYAWLLYSASCCLFEFLLFRDKKVIAKRNKED
ncbi:MAG: hypothetical protein KKE35_05550 [Actinobacteria bacterium]|nr:hypothetical protein [Actinomycetota bacterium]